MDKTTFYSILNIDDATEFQYYENLASLLEEESFIELNLIKDLVKDIDKELLGDASESYFEEFLKALPDDETNLYITVESIERAFASMIEEDNPYLADEIHRFRKWYVLDTLVTDKVDGKELSVLNARYNVQAAKLLGETVNYDFHRAYDYEVSGYDIKITEIDDSDEELDKIGSN